MGTSYSITDKFGEDLARLLAEKIVKRYTDFQSAAFIKEVAVSTKGKTYTQRVEVIADLLDIHLPFAYKEAIHILLSILGEENPKETGMFTNFYWVLPIGKYVEKYGLSEYNVSMRAIAEITKRNTGEYAIRPFIRNFPAHTLQIMEKWAQSDNFHLRRLASEGLRPKLPWATRLDTFNHCPEKVFKILEILKEDPVLFVKKSVANHLTDWLKVDKDATMPLLRRWATSNNKHTMWIVKRASRKIDLLLADTVDR